MVKINTNHSYTFCKQGIPDRCNWIETLRCQQQSSYATGFFSVWEEIALEKDERGYFRTKIKLEDRPKASRIQAPGFIPKADSEPRNKKPVSDETCPPNLSVGSVDWRI